MPSRTLTPTETRIYRRRRIVAAILAVVLLGVLIGGGTYTARAATAALPVATASVTAPAVDDVAVPAVAWPAYGSGAIGMVGGDGVLGSYGPDAPVPIASITKIVTAFVLLQAKPLAADEDGPDITFGPEDVAIYNEQLAVNGSVAPVSDGLVLTEREALTLLLLPSGNNYATSLAHWAYGSTEAYLAAADAWVAQQGLANTSIVDTSGLSPQSTSTPSDLVRLGELALADPVISSIVAIPSTTIPGVGLVENTNVLLGQQGIDGLKTGTTDEAGACLLFSFDATVEGRDVTLVGVVLGGATHSRINADILALIPTVLAGFHDVTIATAGERLGTVTTVWGDEAEVVAGEDVSTFVWGQQTVGTTVELAPAATADDGDGIGSIAVSVGSTELSVPLLVDGELDDPGFGWRLTHPDELFAPAA